MPRRKRKALVKGDWKNAGVNSGRVTEVTCPRAGCGGEILYNGNYFCEYWSDTCTWALPHPARRESDKRICALLGVDEN